MPGSLCSVAVPDLVQIRGKKTSSPEQTPLPEDAPLVYVETFGCQMNEADSALIKGQLRRAGYGAAQGPEHADVILVNTCAVREKAEQRVYGRTTQLLRHREQKPDLVIINRKIKEVKLIELTVPWDTTTNMTAAQNRKTERYKDLTTIIVGGVQDFPSS